MELMTVICVMISIVAILTILLASAIRVVPEYERLVIFRLGRCIGARGPGVVLLIPAIDLGVKVNLREQIREISPQALATKDKQVIQISFVWYFVVMDPVEMVLHVHDFEAAASALAVSTLQSLVAEMSLVELLPRREQTGDLLRRRMNEATRPWGVEVSKVKLGEITEQRPVHPVNS